MPICVDGHQTTAEDFCDQCGMPVVAGEQPPAAPDQPPPVTTCPNCGSPHQPGALFCESCGYDYTTGALPDQDFRTELGLPADSDKPADSAKPTDSPKPVTPAPASPAKPAGAPAPAPSPPPAKSVPHVAEIWTDPQWYAFQESSDPLPPLGPPRIVPLKDSALIGRHSASRNIHPDIDCEPDVGCSRRQAYLTSANGYWYVNDLESANGTFVAPATASLPDEPIGGRTQVGPDDRIYVGAWTRIVVRPATTDEIPTLTGTR